MFFIPVEHLLNLPGPRSSSSGLADQRGAAGSESFERHLYGPRQPETPTAAPPPPPETAAPQKREAPADEPERSEDATNAPPVAAPPAASPPPEDDQAPNEDAASENAAAADGEDDPELGGHKVATKAAELSPGAPVVATEIADAAEATAEIDATAQPVKVEAEKAASDAAAEAGPSVEKIVGPEPVAAAVVVAKEKPKLQHDGELQPVTDAEQAPDESVPVKDPLANELVAAPKYATNPAAVAAPAAAPPALAAPEPEDREGSSRRGRGSHTATVASANSSANSATSATPAAQQQAAPNTAIEPSAAPAAPVVRPDATAPRNASAAPDQIERADGPAALRNAHHLWARGGQRAAKMDHLSQADQARFLQRVSRALESMQGRPGEMRLRLSPPELGALRLEVKVQNGVLSARIEAESSMARSTLLEHLPVLRERLAEQGIRVDQFDVDLMDRQDQPAADGFREPTGDQGSSRHTPGPHRELEAAEVAATDEVPLAPRIIASGELNIIV